MGGKYDAAFKQETIRMIEQERQRVTEESARIGVYGPGPTCQTRRTADKIGKRKAAKK